MALKLKYKDEHGVLHINMSPSTPDKERPAIADPQFDTINHRFGHYDLFGGKYEEEGSLFRSRYNSIEEELANTPYAFATDRSLNLDVTVSRDASPSKDIEDDRFFNRNYDDDLFGPQIDPPAFTVTQLIHAQDRYYDLSSRQGSVESPRVNSLSLEVSARERRVEERKADERRAEERAKGSDDAFKVLSTDTAVKGVQVEPPVSLPVVPTSKRKRESSFAIIGETPTASRPSSPRSLPVEIRQDRRSPFRGRGFREETSRHNTPKTSAANSLANSRANSPPRRRTSSLSKIDKMAQAAALPLPIPNLNRPHSPRNFVKENIEEVRELSELNRERHEADAEKRRKEEEETLLKEMGLLEQNAKANGVKSTTGSRSTSRSNSPNKIKFRSRSNSPAAILHYEKIPTESKDFITADESNSKPVTHRSRVRSVSKSQPQSNEGSPKHSKIPKRQNSVSPARYSNRRDSSNSRKPVENGLRNQKFISNSTSSIHETIKIGSQVHDKRNMSKSTQFLSISPSQVKGKPPISPGRGGPPPSNKSINSKRLSPIVGTPNKSPVEDPKPSSAKTPTKPSAVSKKPIKTTGNTPATSRLNSRQPSRTVSRDPSPDKRKAVAKPAVSSKSINNKTKTITRTPSTKNLQKPPVINKVEPKKIEKPTINRTNSVKSLVRTPSTKTLNEKPPLFKKGSKKDLTEKAKFTTKVNEVGNKKEPQKDEKKPNKLNMESESKKEKPKEQNENQLETKKSTDSGTDAEEISKQDNETQYDKITNEKGELVILTKKNIVSMTTAAITSQPLEVVTTVTNQLPVALEKAREKGIFERLNSRDSLAPKDDETSKENEVTKETDKREAKIVKPDVEDKNKSEDNEKKAVKSEDKKAVAKPKETNSLFIEDNLKFRPLQPPYNNPQVARVKQKIDDILKTPEVSTENILATALKPKEQKSTFKNIADKTKNDVADAKNDVAKKLTDIKDQALKQNDKLISDIRSDANKIVDSIMTPVEEPKALVENVKNSIKKDIEPIVMVVNEKKNGPAVVVEKMTETLVKGEPDVEVQSSNLSTPANKVIVPPTKKAVDGNSSDKSSHSNGGFPQSTSTTPKPPARTRKQSKDEKPPAPPEAPPPEPSEDAKRPNICSRLMGKCKSKCCPCCIKGEDDGDMEEGKKESRFNWFRKKETEENVKEIERAAGKSATIEFEDETKRKRSLRELCCGCCRRQRRVSDASGAMTRDVTPLSPAVVREAGCCGKKAIERRDSILSDRPPPTCCTRLSTWARGMCRRHSEHSSSRRTSMFSKNKSLSPTLPPEDTRKKLDVSLVEHTSVMKGAIPVLPILLACFCLLCNVLVPGLGTILSGIFCLCFGIPRFGVHDGAKHRIGSLVINIIVGCGQLFTVLFCLVGWGWSIWWGVIMLKISRKYRKLKAEAAAEEAEAAPPVTANNHTA